MSHRRTLAAALVVAVATLAPASADAQFGKFIKKAAEKVAVDKATEKAATTVMGDSSATQAAAAPADAAAGGRGARRAKPATAEATGTTEELIRTAISYDQAYMAARTSLLDSDARFASFKKARADYERCYARYATNERATQRYQRLMEEARLQENDAAYRKWSDSLSAAMKAKVASMTPDGCEIPEMSEDLARAAREGAAKAAEAKAGTSEAALAGFQERVAGYLRLSSAAERQQAVSSGAYSAADAAAFDRNRDALGAWLAHSSWSSTTIDPDPKAVAQFDAEMARYESAAEAYKTCSEAANAAGQGPAMPPSMMQQQMNMKPPTEAQVAEAQRLGELAQAAHKSGDNAKAMAYSDSAQKILGIKAAASSPEQQKYARESIAAHQKSMAAMKKCGAPPEQPVKPAYMR